MGYCIECGEFPSEGMGFGYCRYCGPAIREKKENLKRFGVELTNEQILSKFKNAIKKIITQKT